MSDVISLISVPFPRRPPMTLFFSALARLHRSSRADGKFSIRWQGTDDLSCSVRLPRPRRAVHFSSSASPAGDLICPWFSLFFSVSFFTFPVAYPFKYLLSLFSYLICWCIFFKYWFRMGCRFFVGRQALLLFTFIPLRLSPRPGVEGGKRR